MDPQTLAKFIEWLITWENWTTFSYLDGTNNPTIGVGFNMNSGGFVNIRQIMLTFANVPAATSNALYYNPESNANALTDIAANVSQPSIQHYPLQIFLQNSQISSLVRYSAAENINWCVRRLTSSVWNQISNERKIALVDMTLNGGTQFFDTLAPSIRTAIPTGNWNPVATVAQSQNWYSNTTQARADADLTALRNNTMPTAPATYVTQHKTVKDSNDLSKANGDASKPLNEEAVTTGQSKVGADLKPLDIKPLNSDYHWSPGPGPSIYPMIQPTFYGSNSNPFDINGLIGVFVESGITVDWDFGFPVGTDTGTNTTGTNTTGTNSGTGTSPGYQGDPNTPTWMQGPDGLWYLVTPATWVQGGLGGQSSPGSGPVDPYDLYIPSASGNPQGNVIPNGNTGTNTGTDTGTNTGTNTGTDTGTNTGTNTGTDTGTNTGTDTGTATTGTDTGTNTGTNTGTDTGTNTGTDTGTNTGTNTGTAVIAGTDTGTNTGGTFTGTTTGTFTGTNSETYGESGTYGEGAVGGFKPNLLSV